MCQPAPGPRCSGHARQALERAQNAYNKADDDYFDAKEQADLYFREHVNVDLPHGSVLAQHSKMEAGVARLHQGKSGKRALLSSAKSVYDTTPAGQRDFDKLTSFYVSVQQSEKVQDILDEKSDAASRRHEQIVLLKESKSEKRALKRATPEQKAVLYAAKRALLEDQADASLGKDARARIDASTNISRRLHSQVGAGMPVALASQVHRVDDVNRHPDGSTNAYVYEPPTPGFKHGRCLPVLHTPNEPDLARSVAPQTYLTVRDEVINQYDPNLLTGYDTGVFGKYKGSDVNGSVYVFPE